MTLRPRPQVMRLTEAAAARIRALQVASGKAVEGVRIGVKNGGCAGMEYTMEYAEARGPHDEVVEDKGVKLLIDPSAVLFLLGTEMDFRTDRMRSGFVFNNPNQTSACGCGEFCFAKACRGRGARWLRSPRRVIVTFQIDVIPAKAGIQYSPRDRSGYWIARSSRAMTRHPSVQRHPEAAAKRPSKDAARITILRGSLRSHPRMTAFLIPTYVLR